MTTTREQNDDYPIALIQDRYQGVYSGGAWLAIANASELIDATNTRAQFCLSDQDGPSGSDVEAAAFWSKPPSWIATGATPSSALEALGQRDTTRPTTLLRKLLP